MRAPDRTLKRLVAKLARASSEDIEAVLGGLDRPHRTMVESLLSSYRGEAVATRAPTEPSTAAPMVIEGLSPWLMARLQRPAQSAAERPGAFGELVGAAAREAGLAYRMTAAAFETLAACAATMEQGVAEAPARRTGARKRLLGGRAL